MLLFQWLFDLITDFIQPLSDMLTSRADIADMLADCMVILVVLGLCFTVGLLVKTSVGRWIHHWMDMGLAKFAPGYSTIRDIVVQFVGGSEEHSLLNGQVALVKLYGDTCELQVTGIVTSKYDEGFTVFVPTAPVPTSGMVYHVPAQYVTLLPDVSVEQALRTVIACGAGSQSCLLEQAQMTSSNRSSG